MINWDRVDELRHEIGEKEFAEVCEIFLEEVEEVIARLKSNPNPALFEQDLHFLKSSSLNLGFDSLSALCCKGERLAARGDTRKVELAPVFDAFEASKHAFRQTAR